MFYSLKLNAERRKKCDSSKCSTSAKLNESEELRPALWLISFGLTCWSGLYVVYTRLCVLVGVCSRLNLFLDSNLGAFSLVKENGLISAPFHSKSILGGPSHKFFFFCFVLFCCFFLPHLFLSLSLLFLKRRFFALYTFQTQKYGLQSLICLHSINSTFIKAWVSHTNAFSIHNMQLK